MSVEFWDSLSIFFIYFFVVCFVALSFELGFQIGKYTRSHYEKHSDTSPGPMVAAVLTMLAFILAFMFSMTASRFDNRKQLVVEEVNAISTAYFQADLLAQPQRSEVKHLLREYVDIRLRAIKEKTQEIGIKKSLQLQKNLWATATSVANNDTSIHTTLLLQTINQIMNIHEKRVSAAIHDRIPSSIWIALILIIALSMITLGTQTGLVRTRRIFQFIPSVLAFSALITLVIDLDRPAELGLVQVNQEAMLVLQKNMNRVSE